MNKQILFALLLIVIGAGAAYGYVYMSTPEQTTTNTNQAGHSVDEFCREHQIAEKDCPWCDPSIIESMGECEECGVPEALCARCNPDLIAGFKAENDWCAEHMIPESQCTICLDEGRHENE